MADTQTQSAALGAPAVWRSVRRRLPLILLCVAAATGTALALSLSETKKYSASASLLFRDPGFSSTVLGGGFFAPINDPNREQATNLKLVALQTVANRTAQKLGPPVTGGLVSSEVSVAAQGQSNLISVTATDPVPSRAARIANTFAEQYIAFRRNADRSKINVARRLVQSQLQGMSAARRRSEEGKLLKDRGEQLRILASLQTGNAEVVQRAGVPTAASSPNPRRSGMIGGIFGLLLGLGLAFLLERLDRRIKDPEELSSTFELPLLAVVPQSRAYSREERMPDLTAVEAEAFHMLRARLRYFNVDRDIRSVLVTSAAAGDGKSTIAWHLAATAALTGSRVVLVEIDFRRPTVARQRKLRVMPGLAELLSHHVPLEDVVQRVPVGIPSTDTAKRHLDVLVAGATPPNPSELVESHAMGDLLDRLVDAYDLVVIDTPPTSLVSDAIPLMTRVSGVIVVSRSGTSTRESAAHLRDQLRQFSAPTLGVVANAVKDRAAGYYGYGYGYAPDDANGSKRRRRSRKVAHPQLTPMALEESNGKAATAEPDDGPSPEPEVEVQPEADAEVQPEVEAEVQPEVEAEASGDEEPRERDPVTVPAAPEERTAEAEAADWEFPSPSEGSVPPPGPPKRVERLRHRRRRWW